MQTDHGFKKYQLQKKFIFMQLVAKIDNFADIRQNNCISEQKKKSVHFKTNSREKSQIFQIFEELQKIVHFKVNQPQKKLIIRLFISISADFLAKE